MVNADMPVNLNKNVSLNQLGILRFGYENYTNGEVIVLRTENKF